MKNLIAFLLLSLSITACRQTEPVSDIGRLSGTYDIYRLTQYQDGKLILDGYLPYLAPDSSTIRKRVSVDPIKDNSTAPTYVILSGSTTKGNTLNKFTGGNLGGLNIHIRLGVNGYDFYRDGTLKIGHGDGIELSFDTEETDSTGHIIRYVFSAKKISNTPNSF